MRSPHPTSPLLTLLPGAVPAEGPDEGVAAHYGDPFREQRALTDGTGFVDLSHRGVVTVTGADRLSWLHLVLSQHMTELPDGQGTEALVLDSHGRVDCHLMVTHHEDVVYLDTEAGAMATSALPTSAGRKSSTMTHW